MVAASTGGWPTHGFIPLHTNKEPTSTLVYLPRCDKRFSHRGNRDTRWRSEWLTGKRGACSLGTSTVHLSLSCDLLGWLLLC